MKKPRTKKQYVDAIIDLLFMKEPPEAEHLLNLICKTNDLLDSEELVKRRLIAESIGELKRSYNIAVIIADATYCDTLEK